MKIKNITIEIEDESLGVVEFTLKDFEKQSHDLISLDTKEELNIENDRVDKHHTITISLKCDGYSISKEIKK